MAMERGQGYQSHIFTWERKKSYSPNPEENLYSLNRWENVIGHKLNLRDKMVPKLAGKTLTLTLLKR
jgi:hypothetical protein